MKDRNAERLFWPCCHFTIMANVTLTGRMLSCLQPCPRLKLVELSFSCCYLKHYLKRAVGNEIWKSVKPFADTVQTPEIFASETVNWYPSMLRQETSDHGRYFVTAQGWIDAPYFLGNLMVFPRKFVSPQDGRGCWQWHKRGQWKQGGLYYCVELHCFINKYIN